MNLLMIWNINVTVIAIPVIIAKLPKASPFMWRCTKVKSDKEVHNFFFGYVIGQKIRKALEILLGIAIAVVLWCIPLWLFNFLGIGHS